MSLPSGLLCPAVSILRIRKSRYFKKGFSGGITYEYRLKKYFLFEADLVYSQSGFENDITIVDENGQPVYGTGRLEFQFDYVSLPVKAGFIIGNKISGFRFASPIHKVSIISSWIGSYLSL